MCVSSWLHRRTLWRRYGYCALQRSCLLSHVCVFFCINFSRVVSCHLKILVSFFFAKWPFPWILKELFATRFREGSMLSFIGRRHDFGAHLNECENCEFLCRPETRRSPLRELPLLKRINRVCRFVGFSWKLARMFVRYQLTQSMWNFYEIRSISLVTCRSVTVTEILFIVKLQNRFSQAPIEISKKTSHTLLAY